ncbi:MAG: hypothetical protein DRO06_03390 [Thermoproteota archaeon]|nr:MAG: hypothetical protein DRO06_03390 [Candidatus Korarchaeota archaeon]
MIISEERLIKAGMFGETPASFLRRVLVIAAAMGIVSFSAWYRGYLESPAYAAAVTLLPPALMLTTPYLNSLNMASKLERDMWAYLATIWMLQKVGNSVSSSLRAAGSIAEDREVREYFERAAAVLEAAGTLRGLELNSKLSPSAAWSRVYARLADYLATRGEAADEMLRVELDEAVEKTMISIRETVERLTLILIIYTLTSTVFPFVMMLMFSFQALVEQSGVPMGALMSVILVTLIPAPFFVVLFKIFTPKYFRFRGSTVLHAWLSFFGVSLLAYSGLFMAIERGILPPQLTMYHAAALALSLGGLVGWLTIRSEEARLRGQSFDFPLLLSDLFAEMRGGRTFTDAVLTMKAPYKHLRDLTSRMKAWAALRLPYMSILRAVADQLRQSVSRLTSLLIIQALDSGADLEESFAAISSVATKMRERWIEVESTKKGNYINTVLALVLVLGSYILLFRILNIEEIAAMASEAIREALMLQMLIQVGAVSLSLGTVRTGHVTSSLREIAFLYAMAFVAFMLV